MRAQCENLKAYLDGESGLSERLMMRVHLRSCAACREDAREFRAIDKAVRRIERTPMPEPLRDRIMTEAVAAVDARALACASRPSFIHGRSTMSKVVFAAVMVAAIAVIGLGIVPRDRGNSAFADVVRAMSKVRTVHFSGWVTIPPGRRVKAEGWISAPSRLRMRIDGWHESIDDGKIVVDLTYLVRPARAVIRPSGNSSFVTKGGNYLGMLTGRRFLSNSPTAKPRRVFGRDGRALVAYEIGNKYGRTVVTVDPDSDLIVGAEVRRPNVKPLMILDSISYNTKIPDSIFNVSIPKGATVIDMTVSPSSLRKSSRQAAMVRLFAEHGRDVILRTFGRGTSGGTRYHPGFIFETACSDGIVVAYLPDRDLYRVVGRAWVHSQDDSFSRIVEDEDLRLPRVPQIERHLGQSWHGVVSPHRR